MPGDKTENHAKIMSAAREEFLEMGFDKTSVQMSEKADYGNWVPAAMMKTLWCASAALGVGTLLLFLLFNSKIPGIILLIVTIMALCMTIYMQRYRQMFDFNGGGVMGDVHHL